MVAYSFRPQFAEPIATLAKRQTVRALGKRRHARPGEPLQLYTGMRTRQCRKLLDVDPVCIDVRPIEIRIGGPAYIAAMSIDGAPLSRDEIEAFACADGFGAQVPDGFAALRMNLFWQVHHPLLPVFEGVVIRWEPR